MAKSSGTDVYDVLIVGGGPAGTAAAFRSRELGLSCLVIDFDDLMKRIRDYSKDKLILPDFGGGDRQCFPKGGELVSCLQFEAIDKDDLCAGWKELYRKHGVEARVGVELTRLERQADDTFSAFGWDHREQSEECFAARHVVLALGRGVPRRFDIPGNTDGISYRLTDAERFVGQPACVVGGGTSAAEAVIAISNAKVGAGDLSSVYWSYRGDRMPRVSKALADVFFAAYVGNGNIRYYRKSEPVAIFVGDDRREYLAIRVDRLAMAERPSELRVLEFPKEACIACIGEDIPETFLSSVGIGMVVGGEKKKKRMVVNRYLETCEPRVYLIGDLLSQAYFETDDFDADPAGFSEIKHRGNIKSALRDGVKVAQVIAQRCEGRSEIDVGVEDAEEGSPKAGASTPTVASVGQAVSSDGPPLESLDVERREGETDAILVRLLPTGVEGEEYAVKATGVTTIGMADCDLSFPNDSTLSPRHGSISHTDEGYFLRDDGSSGGVFLRVAVARKVELEPGDLLRAGRQFLVLSQNDDGLTLIHYDARGAEVGRHELPEGKALVLGRQTPGGVLDGSDGTLSRRHLAILRQGETATVKDLKSVNGTFLRVRSARKLEHGDQIRMGAQIFTFSLRPEAVLDAEPPGAEIIEGPPAPAVEKSAPGRAPTLSLEGSDQTAAIAPGQTITDAAEAAGIEINAECHAGICGSDPVRIVSGAENLVGELSDQERETLEELCEVEPGPCRLACMVKAKGPVKIEIL